MKQLNWILILLIPAFLPLSGCGQLLSLLENSLYPKENAPTQNITQLPNPTLPPDGNNSGNTGSNNGNSGNGNGNQSNNGKKTTPNIPQPPNPAPPPNNSNNNTGQVPIQLNVEQSPTVDPTIVPIIIN